MSTPAPLQCIVSVSGIRGVIGDDLNIDQILHLASACGSTVGELGTVIVGRDSRPTGAMLTQAVCAGLRAVGCHVIDIGIVPTPTVPVAVLHHGASAGIQVSSSHNPVEWNALKFFNKRGRNVDGSELDWILAAYADPPRGHWRRWDGVGGQRTDDQAIVRHIERVLAGVDGKRIRSRRPHVVIDCVNGSGAEAGPQLLTRLGCKVTVLHGRSDLPFPRDPEPTEAHCAQTAAAVRALGADVGLVQDPDADRLALIDETGRYIGEEYTLVLCAAARFAAHGPGAVACTNLSTSRMLDDVAAKHGARVVRTPVGEANVVDAIEREKAVIGGEGNGGVIDPRVVLGRDSQAGMALVLELMARSEQPLSALVAGIPRYAMHKRKIALDRPGVAGAISRLRGHAFIAAAQRDERDGLRLDWNGRWVHLRASGTEPVSRVIAEAGDHAAATELVDELCAAAGIDGEAVH